MEDQAIITKVIAPASGGGEYRYQLKWSDDPNDKDGSKSTRPAFEAPASCIRRLAEESSTSGEGGRRSNRRRAAESNSEISSSENNAIVSSRKKPRTVAPSEPVVNNDEVEHASDVNAHKLDSQDSSEGIPTVVEFPSTAHSSAIKTVGDDAIDFEDDGGVSPRDGGATIPDNVHSSPVKEESTVGGLGNDEGIDIGDGEGEDDSDGGVTPQNSMPPARKPPARKSSRLKRSSNNPGTAAAAVPLGEGGRLKWLRRSLGERSSRRSARQTPLTPNILCSKEVWKMKD